MRPWRVAPARWGPIAAAGGAILLVLALLVVLAGREPATSSTAVATPGLSAAGTADPVEDVVEQLETAGASPTPTPALGRTAAPAPRSSAASSSPSSSTSSADVAAARTPVVAFVGDSWTAGYGSASGRGYVGVVGEQLGWTLHQLGVGGSSYLLPGAGGPFADRIAPAAQTRADVVVIQGSLNDKRSDLSAVGPAALDTLSGYRAAVAPGTVIVVVGASHTPGTDPATIEAINEAVGGAARSLGLRFVDPAEENWTDPADPAIWSDEDHPNDAGYRLIADHVSQLLRQVVED